MFSSTNSQEKSFNISDNYDYQGATLKILNKLTTKRYKLVIPLSQSFDVGSNSLIVYKCLVLDRKNQNDHIALIKFTPKENKNSSIFLGWLLKSSPSITGLSDSVYELKLEKCLKKDPLFPELKITN